MDYIWYPAYRAAILETEKPKMRARLLIAEQEMIDRLRVFAMDGGGTAEERHALAHALTGIKQLRSEVDDWNKQKDSDA
jgi:hypothetical protein